MIQKHRIYTDIGKDQKVTLELKQDYDFLEILSLKFTQQQAYTSLCADYGVVCGRVSVNNGFGVPNARVSIFVPLTDVDAEDPVISKLYPYKSITDKDDTNHRYNLLPSRQQHSGHQPTGTFPDQNDILSREEVLQVFETYYSYTVKTNESGDFMIWGVPLGEQTLHIDIDLSDIGCFSLRPYDFIRQGVGVDNFKNSYKFKESQDLDSLPQIKTFQKTIEVYPFWGNQDLCEIGITRTDFDLANEGVKIEPKAYLIGGTFTDSGKNSLNKNCEPRRKMGRKCDLTTRPGKVECIRFTTSKDENHRPILETYELQEDISDDGSFVVPLPMNMDFLYTNEFGENEYTNDPNKGIATSACYRLRMSLSDSGLGRVRANADYLLPNIREYSNDVDKSYAFSTDYNDYPTDANSLILNTVDGVYIPQDYFYRFSYNKVFTVSSFQGSYFNGSSFSKDSFLGIKELSPSEEEDCSGEINTPPVNFGIKNYTFTLLIADVLLFVEQLFNVVLLVFFNTLAKLFHTLGDIFDVSIFGIHPLRFIATFFHKIGYSIQETGQKRLYLINYPECEECNDAQSQYGSPVTDSTTLKYCQVGTINVLGSNDGTVTYTQTIPSTTWTFIHNLGEQFPTVQVFDTSGALILPTILFVDSNTVVITFSSAQSGSATATSTSTSVRKRLTNSFTPGIPSVGTCSTTAVPITSISDFIARQTSYVLNVDNQIYSIEGVGGNTYFEIDTTTGNLIFGDKSSIFSKVKTYNVKILDKNHTSDGYIPPTVELESGCKIYDVPYDRSNGLIYTYYIGTGRTESSTYVPGSDVTATGYARNGWELVSEFHGTIYSACTPSHFTEFSNGIFYVIPGTVSNPDLFRILREYRRRKRVGKMFCGGIVNYGFIDNWLSGALYFFQFKAKGQGNATSEEQVKYCNQVVRFLPLEKRFYYRSTPYDANTDTWGTPNYEGSEYKRLNHPTTFVDLGPRDEFIKEICTDPSLDPNCSVARSIGPTSFQNFGELMGLAINYKLSTGEPDHDIDKFFANGGFSSWGAKQTLDGDLLQLISINSEVGIEEFDLQNSKYLGYSYQVLDPELYPDVFKRSGVWGPTPVTFYLDEDGARIRGCLNEPGNLTESSQNVPFFLWDKKGTGFGAYDDLLKDDQSWDYTSSGIVVKPLQGMTYNYSLTSAKNVNKYLLLPMTYDFDGLTIPMTGNTTNQVDFDVISFVDNHTDNDLMYPGYTYLHVTSGTLQYPLTGTLYTRYGSDGTWNSQPWDYTDDFIIRKTRDYYSGNKQILSTPFQFYFGARHGKTGLDKFIDLFGPKGAFPPIE